jgi:multidrug efflux pump subunit AcrA (membrane-fusion protein)
MKNLLRYTAAITIGLILVVGAFKMLPSSVGKAPPAGHGHGHDDEHAHAEESVTMNDAKVAAAGIGLEKAGPGVLRDTLRLNGILQANQETLVQVTPRFPGIVRDVRKRIGDRVEKDETLATVESNQSLRTYELKTPLAGTVIDRGATLGEYVSEQKPTFVVADLSTIWADFSVYRRDIKKVRIGDTILIDADDAGESIETKVSYISPVGSSDTQTALVRAVVQNPDGRLRPGLFVTGRVQLSERPVPIAIKLSALQTFENRTVVFVRNGEKFEPRDVELGERGEETAEIVFGLSEGDVYAAKNSFVIKAEIAKGTAAHEH